MGEESSAQNAEVKNACNSLLAHELVHDPAVGADLHGRLLEMLVYGQTPTLLDVLCPGTR